MTDESGKRKKSKSPQQIIETHKEISFIDFPLLAISLALALERLRAAASGCCGSCAGWRRLSARKADETIKATSNHRGVVLRWPRQNGFSHEFEIYAWA